MKKYKIVYKKGFLCIIFLIVCISTNFVLECLKFYMDVTNISPKGTVVFVLGFSFHLMSKNG